MEKDNESFILLTSTGLSYEKSYNFVGDFYKKSPCVVSIVVTASEGKKEDKYVKLAIEQFKKIGVENINLIDIEVGELVPSETKIIYVSGGNTFKLMYHVKQSNFIDSIKNTLNQNGLYIGVSAGSIIVGNSIESAGVDGADENNESINNFEGLNLVDFSIFPHSTEKTEMEFKDDKKFINPLFIKNNQAFLVELNGESLVNSEFI